MVTTVYTQSGRAILLGGFVGAIAQNGSSAAPYVVGMDIISGSRINGENNKGAYLTVYLINPGTQANMGTSAGVQIFINGIQVDNYRALVPSKTYGVRPGFPSIYALSVQIGALTGLTDGTPYQMT